MTASAAPTALESAVRSVRRALADAHAPPEVLVFAQAGAAGLADRLEDPVVAPLPKVAELPPVWSASGITSGRLGELGLWLVEPPEAPAPGWQSAFPVWLAAACGARLLVLSSAGIALAGAEHRARLAVARDHLRFGDESPLVGLGQTELGPLFPDLSRLYDTQLRQAASEAADRRGIALTEVVLACTRGPSLETPAERAALAELGAEISVQGAAPALLAAGHAGLRALALVAVAGGEDLSMEALLERAETAAAELDDLLVALAPSLAARVDELRAEELP